VHVAPLFRSPAQIKVGPGELLLVWSLVKPFCQVVKPSVTSSMSASSVLECLQITPKALVQAKRPLTRGLSTSQMCYEALRIKLHVFLQISSNSIFGQLTKGLNKACKPPVVERILGKNNLKLSNISVPVF
jgi:hypothetical protein